MANKSYISPTPGKFPLIVHGVFLNPSNPTKEELLWVKDCGFNAASQQLPTYTYVSGKKEITAVNALSYCSQAQISLSFLYNFYVGTSMSDIQDVVTNTKDSTALGAWQMGDEPAGNQLSYVKECIDEINSIDSSHMAFTNLSYLPSDTARSGLDNPDNSNDLDIERDTNGKDDVVCQYIKGQPLEAKAYYQYLKCIQDYLEPPVWSFDFYPIVEIEKNGVRTTSVRPEYINYLTQVAEISKDTDRPMWAYIQIMQMHFLPNANGETVYYPKPTLPFLRYQCLMSLAFGAQALQFWAYVMQKDRTDEFFINAAIDLQGNRTEIWYTIQSFLSELSEFITIFLGAKVISVAELENDKLTEKTKSTKVVSNPIFGPFSYIESSGKVVISLIAKGRSTYCVIINQDILNPQEIHIKTDSAFKLLNPIDSNGKFPLGGPGIIVPTEWYRDISFELSAGGYFIAEYK